MAVTASGIYVANFVSAFNATQLALDLSLTSHKIALISNSATPNFDTDTGWNSTNEVSGTGWASGGIALSAAAAGGTSTAPTLVVSSGNMVYDMNDISVSGTTLSGARAARIYADALAGDNLILLANFGADFNTTAGTLGIQWGTSVFSIDLTP